MPLQLGGGGELQYNYVAPPTPPSAEAGDIVYKTADGKFKASKANEWNASLGTAVGVCVIPTSHDVYGDGSCAILSLSQATNKQWGPFGTNIDGLGDKTMIGCVGHDENGNWTPTNTVDHTNNYGYICSDKLYKVSNPYDEGTAWEYNDGDCHIASPYNNDGSRNAVYYQTTSPLTVANATADFDGVGNTAKIITKLTELGETDRAAQVAKAMTDGGLDWYLPAIGELAYIMPRFNKINEGLQECSGTQMGKSVTFWSSSEYSNRYAWHVGTDNGHVYNINKDYGYRVLGFARVSLSV